MRTAKTPILTLKEITLAVLLAILLIGSITYANAQSTSLLKSDPQIKQKMEAVQQCPDLQKQLIAQFGNNYSLYNPKVQDFLKILAQNTKLNYQLRSASNAAATGKPLPPASPAFPKQ